MKPKVIDLFAGVGGLSLGFENSGFDVILANEYDPSIAAAYEENHKGTKMICGDITSLDLQKTFSDYAGKVDVIIGGPPCQGFSQKGQRKTIHDERNFLFKYYVKVVELVQPSYFVMENVPNLLTAEGGCFRKEIEGRAINTYGEQPQVDMAIEEMPELTKASLKHRRNEDMSVADLKSRTNIDLL